MTECRINLYISRVHIIVSEDKSKMLLEVLSAKFATKIATFYIDFKAWQVINIWLIESDNSMTINWSKLCKLSFKHLALFWKFVN